MCYIFEKAGKDLFRRRDRDKKRKKKKFSRYEYLSRRVVDISWGNFHVTRERWQSCIWQEQFSSTWLFYECFVTWPPATPPPSPFSKGDYFLLICITPRPTKGARDRPCHCNVNKLRLPDLLPRGGHASSFVIAPPLSLYCNAETSTGRQTFFTNPRVSPYSLSPPSPSMTIIVAKWYIPSSTAIYFHVAILRGVIK